MNPSFEKYIENLRESKKRNKPSFSPGLSKDEYIQAVRENAAMHSKLKAENDAVLSDPSLGICLPPEKLTPEMAADLKEFSAHLSKFMMQLDNPLCHVIHKQLLEYARIHNNLDDQIQESYYCGLTLYYINRISRNFHINKFNDDVISYFSFSANFLNRIQEFESTQTRSFILRSFCNIKLGFDHDIDGETDKGFYPARKGEFFQWLKHSRQEIRLFSDPDFRAQVPDYNWDSALYALHMGMTITLVYLRHRHDPEIAEQTYRSAQYVYFHEAAANGREDQMLKPRIHYFYQAARFHKGYLSIGDLLDFFYKRVHFANPNGFTVDDAFDNLHCGVYYLYYRKNYSDFHTDYDPRYKEVCEHIEDYMHRFPSNEYLSTVISQFSSAISLYQQDSSLEEYLLNLLISFHQPTYVHSQAVAWLSRQLMAELVYRNPQLFLEWGIYSSVKELYSELEELLDRTYRAGSYHDVGKVMVLDHVSQYARHLMNIEFDILQMHSYSGFCTLSHFPQTERYALNALGHHRYYDESRGYPDCYHRTHDLTQLITDVLTVADSLDAATDDIGRCYAGGISFEQLFDELRQQAGTRYAPYVVQLFDDSAFAQKLSKNLVARRQTIYYDAYLALTSKSKK